MKEITFKADTNEELFFLVEQYYKGYIESNGMPDKYAKIKSKFLELNPIGTKVISNTRTYKFFPYGKEYEILDIKVHGKGTPMIEVFLKDDNGNTQWKDLSKFYGYRSL